MFASSHTLKYFNRFKGDTGKEGILRFIVLTKHIIINDDLQGHVLGGIGLYRQQIGKGWINTISNGLCTANKIRIVTGVMIATGVVVAGNGHDGIGIGFGLSCQETMT